MKTNLGIIGAGNQALAWAQNLKDAGEHPVLLLREGSPALHGKVLERQELTQSLGNFDILALLIPDDQHKNFFKTYSEFIKPGTIILYAHGYSLNEDQLAFSFPDFQHVLFAPKSIGHEIRNNYLRGRKTPAVYSLEFLQSDTKKKALASLSELSENLGFFLVKEEVKAKDEVTTDLFSEQALLCGVYPYLINECFQILKENGVNSQLSFLECWHESKLIMDTMIEKGPLDFFKLISPNALIGSQVAFEKIFDSNFREKLRSLFQDIQNGVFSQKLKSTNFKDLRQKNKNFWQSSELQKEYEHFKDQLYRNVQ